MRFFSHKNSNQKFSFHYVAYAILTFFVVFSVVRIVQSATPNPGHPWIEVGDGNITFTGTTTNKTFTLPDANATILTTNDLVTVGQGGTGASTLTGILIGNGTSAFTSTTLGAGQSIRRNATDTAYEAFTAGSGDVTGPSSATDGGVALFDTTTGKLLKNSSNFVQLANGNVGIGTTNPSQKLHVNNGYIFLSENYGITWSNGSESIVGLGSAGNYSLQFNTYNGSNNTEKMRITGSGLVGIGTTSPTAILHIKAGTATAGTAPLKLTSGVNLSTPEAGAMEFDGTRLYFTPSGNRETLAFTSDLTTGYVPYTGATSSLNLGANNLIINTNTFFADASAGRIGIGTTNPTSLFHVNGSSIFEGGAIFNGSVSIDTDPTNNPSGFEYGNGYDPTITNYDNEKFRVNSFFESPFVSMGVAQNYLLQTEVFDNDSWVKTDIGTVSANGVSAPNGAVSAEQIPAGSNANANISQTITNSTTGYWTAGVWARAQSGTSTISIRIDSSSETGTEKIINLTTRWQFFSVTQNFTSAHTTKTFRIISGTNAISLWGARMSAGQTAQAYYTRTTSALTSATPGVFFNNSTIYGTLSGSATSSTYSSYSNYGVYIGGTLSDTVDKTDQWEYFGDMYLAYNSTYRFGQSWNIEVILREKTSNNSLVPQQDLEKIVLKLKGDMPTVNNSTEFNNTVPNFSVEIFGDTDLTANDIAARINSSSTSNKYIYLYIKLKNPNTNYLIEAQNRYGLSYSSAGVTSTSYAYFTARAGQATVSSLPAPAQGSIVYATKVSGINTWQFNGDNIYNLNTGNIGIGTTDPTAFLHLKAGTATAGTAPLKLTSGVNLSTPEAGAMEFDGTRLYFTPSGNRETLAFTSDIVASPITIVNNSNLFSTGLTGTGSGVTMTTNSIFLGEGSGDSAFGANNSNFFGYSAGAGSHSASHSNFFGYNAGIFAVLADNSNFFGQNAGNFADSASYSNFFGYNAGNEATYAHSSNFFGKNAGDGAVNAANSIFMGSYAGEDDLVDNTSWLYDEITTFPDTSILIGHRTSTGGFSNSIAIGAYATNTASNQLSIGSANRPISSLYINGVDYTLPSAQGGVNTYLRNDGSGVLSWDPLVSSQWTTAGSNIYYNSGNVGIGTTSPGQKLTISSDTGAGIIGNILTLDSFNGGAGNGAGILFTNNNQVVKLSAISSRDAGSYGGNLLFYTKPADGVYGNPVIERMRINEIGNIGIGITNPVVKLNVAALVADNTVMTPGTAAGLFSIMAVDKAYGLFAGVKSNTGDAWIQVGRSDGTATAYNLLLQPNGGNIGIGTTAPTSQLHIASSSTNDTANFYGNSGTANVLIGANGKLISSGGQYRVYSSTNVPLALGSNNSYDDLFINTSGKVGIGTTNPSYTLHVSNGNNSEPTATFTSSNTLYGTQFVLDSTGAGGREFRFFSTGSTNPIGGGKTGIYDASASSYRLVMDSSGNVGIGTTSPSYKLQVEGAMDSSAKGPFYISASSVSAGSRYGVGFGLDASTNSMGGRNYSIMSGGTNAFVPGGFAIYDSSSSAYRFSINSSGYTTIGIISSQNATSASQLGVNGNVSIGNGYFQTAAPTNGMIVEGNVGIGLTAPSEKLAVAGNIFANGQIRSLIGGENINIAYAQGGQNYNGSGPYTYNQTIYYRVYAKNSSGEWEQTPSSFSVYIDDQGTQENDTVYIDIDASSGEIIDQFIITRSLDGGVTYNYYHDSGTNFNDYYYSVTDDGTIWTSGTFTPPSSSSVDTRLGYLDGNNDLWGLHTTGPAYISGNVGIGTTNPNYALEVNGIIYSSDSNYISGYSIIGRTSVESPMFFNTTDANTVITTRTATKDIVFILNQGTGAEIMRLTSAGNVGIGTSNPTSKLEVVGDVHINSPTGSLKFGNDFEFVTGTSDVTVKDSGGNTIMIFDEL